ncbi:MAG TPA: type IV pilus assembly protein PilM [Candidatus Moranbacteria bacterium]|nr:type IV pilus assembly protein PilM [Candidatus Moranbacteria bacterium]
MFGLNFGKNTFVGIDIGTSAIKAMEIKVSGGKPVLSNYAWAAIPEFSGRDDIGSSYFETAFPQYLQRLMKESKMDSGNIYISVPAFGGLITFIEFPQMNEGDMEQAIKFEAHKYIPTSLDEVVLSWDIIGKTENGNEKKEGAEAGLEETKRMNRGNVQVLLVAASKARVMRYEKVVYGAGMKIKSIELESFSLVRSLVGNDPGRFVIIDIGSRVCNMVLVDKGIIRSNRNIDAGGRDMTKMIAKSMGIDFERAEKMKISGKDFFAKDSYINFSVLEMISGEVRRMISSCYKNQENVRMDGIILSGGSANLYGLENYFTNSLGIKTLMGNPFGRINYDKKLEPIIKNIQAKFAVSAGLALQGADNFLNNKK